MVSKGEKELSFPQISLRALFHNPIILGDKTMNNAIENPVVQDSTTQPPANLSDFYRGIKKDAQEFLSEFGKSVGDDLTAIREHISRLTERVNAYTADLPSSVREATLVQTLEIAFIKAPAVVLVKAVKAIDAILSAVLHGTKTICKMTANIVIFLQNLMVRAHNRRFGTKYRSWEFYNL